MRSRRTARVFVFDPAHRILLIRFVVPRTTGDFIFWLTPGGEIEPTESPAQAAARELREELGLDLSVTGPIYTEANRFEHHGEMRDNLDFFFTAKCAADAPILTGITPDEIALMREIRWWTLAQIEASRERFFPSDLPIRMRAFLDNEHSLQFPQAFSRPS